MSKTSNKQKIEVLKEWVSKLNYVKPKSKKSKHKEYIRGF